MKASEILEEIKGVITPYNDNDPTIIQLGYIELPFTSVRLMNLLTFCQEFGYNPVLDHYDVFDEDYVRVLFVNVPISRVQSIKDYVFSNLGTFINQFDPQV